MNPYLRPLYDASTTGRSGACERLIRKRHHRNCTIAFMRGRNAQRCLRHPRRGAEHHIRTDEDVPHRLGCGSKAVVTGDIPRSICRPRASRSGRGMKVVSKIDGIASSFDDSRRRAPQAGAADRQGLRIVYRKGRAGLRLQVSVIKRAERILARKDSVRGLSVSLPARLTAPSRLRFSRTAPSKD